MNYAEVDCYITDPPYNVDYEGSAGKIANDHMDDNSFMQFLHDAFSCAYSVMKPGASFYIWHADSNGYAFRKSANDTGLKVRQCLIWKKDTLVLGRQDYQWIHEPCLYGWKEGASHYFIDDHSFTTVYEDGINIDKMKLTDARDLLHKLLDSKVPTSVINEPKPARNAEHPTMKPVKLIGRIMANSTKKGDVVYDGFGGSGTTLIAAEQLHRRCYMMELDPRFVDVIIKRYEEFTGDKAVLLNDR